MSTFNTTEIVEIWPDGKHVVKYRRPFGSKSAQELMDETDRVNAKIKGANYYYQHV